jgi:hypothetical protein
MRSRSSRGALLLALLVLPPAYAQKATEQFIPIGQSPGISGVETRIGEIVASDNPSPSAGGRVWSNTKRPWPSLRDHGR